jgi:pyridoxine 5-phosphate synthase
MAQLGVNIDHVATLRQARGEVYPDPVMAALLAELGGARQITVHLREDRRHIQEQDVRALRQTLTVPLNLEMAVEPEILALACDIRPAEACLVPERRQELTTEGGLDVAGERARISDSITQLNAAGVLVSLFVDPDPAQLEAARECQAQSIELHTGAYATARGQQQQSEFARLSTAARHAHSLGLKVNAGHGLHYTNTAAIAALPEVDMLNIGHSIVARAVFVGLQCAVSAMVQIIDQATR